MRKLILQVQLSVDGFVAGPNGEMDFMTWNWDDALKEYTINLTDSVDSILLGRKMTSGFITYWTSVVQSGETNPEYPFARKMIDKPKWVFTKTLEKSEWDNTTLAKGDIVAEVNALKQRQGKNMVVYGGANFVANLVKYNLIDEYHLFINPAAIGTGMSIFNLLEGKRDLKLVKATSFDCGIVVLHYGIK